MRMIILYSTHCPKCIVLETKLKQLNKEFIIKDNQDEVVSFGKEHDILSTPILVVDDQVMDFTSAIKFLREVK